MEHGYIRMIESDYPDLVLDIGAAVLGEHQRNKMKATRGFEKQNIMKAACSLLNSGGGIIIVRASNNGYSYTKDGIGQDINEGLANLVRPQHVSEFFDFLQHDELLIFVKSWTSGNRQNVKLPRLCTIKCNIYQRALDGNTQLSSMEVDSFLNRERKSAQSFAISCISSDLDTGPTAKRTCHSSNKMFADDVAIIKSANVVFGKVQAKHQFKHGEILDFGESIFVEFKEFSSAKNFTKMKEKLRSCISAFANTEGGFLFFGVDNKSKVVGCNFPNYDDARKMIGEMLDSSLISYPSKEIDKFYVAEVLNESNCIGFLIAFLVMPFHRVVFADKPECWRIENQEMKRLEPNEWVKNMIATDPDIEKLAQNLEMALSITEAPPACKSVCSIGEAGHMDDLQNKLFKVNLGELKHIPEKMYEDLLQEYPGLGNLVSEMKCSGSVGLLIFSRSWAVDIDLSKSPDIICDALLIATNNTPVLYTVAKQKNNEVLKHSKKTALTLKQKLVNVGGYAGKLCIIPKILQYPSDEGSDLSFSPSISPSPTTTPPLHPPLSPSHPPSPHPFLPFPDTSVEETDIRYPHRYCLLDYTTVEHVLRALTIVLLAFKSFLSYAAGCEILSLLTIEQFRILHHNFNIEKCKNLFIHGLPGTGKTVIAMQLVERIRNTFNCEGKEVLYICENKPLQKFIQQIDRCESVTRTKFIREDQTFSHIKHIIVDEAQNFRDEKQNWYDKAERIRKNKSTHPNGPGVFWIFMDYFQISHIYETGLPDINDQDPQAELTKVVRNGKAIYTLVLQYMKTIVQNHGQSGNQRASQIHLQKLVNASACMHSFLGMVHIEKCETQDEIVKYISTKISDYLNKGFAKKHIAILCSQERDSELYNALLQHQFRKIRSIQCLTKADEAQGDEIVLDTIRRFSGLEKSIIFGINPKAHPTQVGQRITIPSPLHVDKPLFLFFGNQGYLTNLGSFLEIDPMMFLKAK